MIFRRSSHDRLAAASELGGGPVADGGLPPAMTSQPAAGPVDGTSAGPVDGTGAGPEDGVKDDLILRVEGVSKSFQIRGNDRFRRKREVMVLDDISLAVRRGESFGLVGESGCGKSTLARTMLRLLEPTAGQVIFDGIDLGKLDRDALRAVRRRMQFVFQDPFASLDPRMTARAIVEEPLQVHAIGTQEERRRKVLEILDEVGLSAVQAARKPHAFSGGQRQRIGIARAFVLRPELVILDEPVSALDVSVQAQVLNLLRGLQQQLGLTYLFISHDLAVAEYFCDRVAVLYLGQVMELADRETLFRRPLHPYTVSLLTAVPVPRPGGRRRRAGRTQLLGEVASVAERPQGCPFEPRCPIGHGKEICRTQRPPLGGQDHLVACHFPGEMKLGVDRDRRGASLAHRVSGPDESQ